MSLWIQIGKTICAIFKKKKMKVITRKVYEKEKPYVICDTNVWYGLASKTFNLPTDVKLIPTAFSLEELATSKMMVNHPSFYKEVLKHLYKSCGPIIGENPFDYVLSNNFSDYKGNEENTKTLLKGFSELMSRKMEARVIDEELRLKILRDCRNSRKPKREIADLGNQDLLEIRRNINVGIGKKGHVKQDSTLINQEMIKVMFDGYASSKNYIINWEKFDWNQIELFLIITEIFFQKLETTKGMKIDENDIVDWFNFLYVKPDEQYLTFEKSWIRYMIEDNRIKHYLYT